MLPEIDFAGRQIQGGREIQEDFYAFEELEEGGLLLVLCDGVGGETSGEVASEIATFGFFDGFAAAGGSIPTRLQAGLVSANRLVAEAIDNDNSLSNMSATLVAAHLHGRHLHWISVGDSPLFLLREERLVRLNKNHAASAVDASLPPNLILSAVTGGRIPLIDLRHDPFRLQAGDLILAASDGLQTLSDSEIRDYCLANPTRPVCEIARQLLQAVKDLALPRQDNATVAMARALA